MKVIVHILFFIFLTLVTQIGGVVYLITLGLAKKRLRRIAYFILLYLISTYLIVPFTAPHFGREQIKDSEFIEAHSIFYKLANRNYVTPELNDVLGKIASKFDQKNEGIKIIYLDANFPFIDKFPLLPHLSHNDGTKLDLTLIYENPNGDLTNKKTSTSGYGVYESPNKNEYNQTSVCKNKGHWQYDFPKYLSLGEINKDIKFSTRGTRQLVDLIVKNKEIGKVFIEPHLRQRMNLNHYKIRFHGCQAVRHDDHIHLQLK